MLDKLKLVAEKYLSASLGIRVAIGFLAGAIGSATVIGFLAEYGAINYALAYGARLPTEGVPYLRYAATGISFALFSIAAGILIVFNWVLRTSLRQFSGAKFNNSSESYETMPLKDYLIQGALPALVGSSGMVQLFINLASLSSMSSRVFLFIPIVSILLLLILGRKPRLAKWFVLIIFATCIGAFFIISFTPSIYGKALYFSRQGGGFPITIKINCEGIDPCKKEISGNLFLRSTEYYFFRDSSTNRFQEIPSRSVDGISYMGEERWGTR